MSLQSNPVFQQYKKLVGERSSSETNEDFVDLDAFEDITPSPATRTTPQHSTDGKSKQPFTVHVQQGCLHSSSESSLSEPDAPPVLEKYALVGHEGRDDDNFSPAERMEKDVGVEEVVDRISLQILPIGSSPIFIGTGVPSSSDLPRSDHHTEHKGLHHSQDENDGPNAGARNINVEVRESLGSHSSLKTTGRGSTKFRQDLKELHMAGGIDWDEVASDEEKPLRAQGNNSSLTGALPKVFSVPTLTHVDTMDEGGIPPISFWEALVLLHEDEHFWKPYASPSPTSKEHKKSRLSFWKMCSCIPSEVSDKQGKWVVSSKKEPHIAEDYSFFNALMFIPFDYDHMVLRRVLFTIYHTMAAPQSVEPWWRRKAMRVAQGHLSFFVEDMEGEGPTMHPCKVAWDRVGFQGTDPATDLRSTGLLGLLQLLYLIDQYPALNRLLWQVCHGEQNTEFEINDDRVLGEELPYALVGFNITGAVVEVTSKGLLEKEVRCMKGGQNVVDTVSQGVQSRTGFASSSTQQDSDGNHVVSYCHWGREERELSKRYPVILTTCEFFVGCIYRFVQAWLRVAKEKEPIKLTVADFHDIRNILFYKWNRRNKQDDLFLSAAESRLLSFHSALANFCRRD